jgi:predicted transglutaminase-like cysteine proteinase
MCASGAVQAMPMPIPFRGLNANCAVIATAQGSSADSGALVDDGANIPEEAPSMLERTRAAQAGIPSSPIIKSPADMGCPASFLIAAAAEAEKPIVTLSPILPIPAQAVSQAIASQSGAISAPKTDVAVTETGRPDILGSVALLVNKTPLDEQWYKVRYSRVNGQVGPWTTLLKAQRGHPRTAQIEAVNSWVNARIIFADDIKTAGKADRWATAAHSLRSRRGDCEDYAIAKMHMLGSLGVATSDMYLVIVRDLVRKADHAVLVVRAEGKLLLLDNSTNLIVDARTEQDYRPIFSYSGNQSWLHGYEDEIKYSSSPKQIASLQ